jgi:hypothetical protein
MVSTEDDDKALRDVKAVLRGLQRIGGQLPEVGAAGNNPGRVAAAVENPAIGENVRPAASKERALSQTIGSTNAALLADKRPGEGRRLAALALAMLAAGTLMVLAGDLFLRYWPDFPSNWRAAIRGGFTSDVVTTKSARLKISTPTLPIETRPAAARAERIDDRPVSLDVTGVAANPDIANARQLMGGGRIAAAREMLLRPDLAASQEGAWLLARSYDPSYLTTVPSPDAQPDKQQAEQWYRRWRDIGVGNGMAMDDMRLKRIIDSMR